MNDLTRLTSLAAIAVALAAAPALTQAALIDNTGVTATASSYNTGGAGFPPIRTIDESGLNTTTGVHNTNAGTSWLTPNSGDITAEWIQWDLGDSYVLDAIHVWNANQNPDFGTRLLDIYVSNVATPGDPEGAGAANWTQLTGSEVTFPEADNTGGYTGFDLETQLGTTLPTSPIQFVRFELNGSYGSDPDGSYTGIAEIQFFAIPEPASMALLGAGLLLIGTRRSQRA